MLTVDLAGILITWWVGAPFYPHWVVIAAIIQEIARVLVVSAWGGTVVAVHAGAWNGSVTAAEPSASVVVAAAGPLLVGLVGVIMLRHKCSWQQLVYVWRRQPQAFSVVCLRVATGNLLWLLLHKVLS